MPEKTEAEVRAKFDVEYNPHLDSANVAWIGAIAAELIVAGMTNANQVAAIIHGCMKTVTDWPAEMLLDATLEALTHGYCHTVEKSIVIGLDAAAYKAGKLKVAPELQVQIDRGDRLLAAKRRRKQGGNRD